MRFVVGLPDSDRVGKKISFKKRRKTKTVEREKNSFG